MSRHQRNYLFLLSLSLNFIFSVVNHCSFFREKEPNKSNFPHIIFTEGIKKDSTK